ncbi:uncharacterized protein LOC130625895 isoform X2 [Hydractinia symbiolongicarpus]|uniref:uncharacterized protein LOC130625895 isoform X2 n=1 Tax=Hydractinia symbiolongicarpus TaxID=13093 RepID=UPI00254BB136|nr:uncharacterized protein LOC130625895 isoform X2 [Hydractinia symbiolongicarpus]
MKSNYIIIKEFPAQITKKEVNKIRSIISSNDPQSTIRCLNVTESGNVAIVIKFQNVTYAEKAVTRYNNSKLLGRCVTIEYYQSPVEEHLNYYIPSPPKSCSVLATTQPETKRRRLPCIDNKASKMFCDEIETINQNFKQVNQENCDPLRTSNCSQSDVDYTVYNLNESLTSSRKKKANYRRRIRKEILNSKSHMTSNQRTSKNVHFSLQNPQYCPDTSFQTMWRVLDDALIRIQSSSMVPIPKPSSCDERRTTKFNTSRDFADMLAHKTGLPTTKHVSKKIGKTSHRNDTKGNEWESEEGTRSYSNYNNRASAVDILDEMRAPCGLGKKDLSNGAITSNHQTRELKSSDVMHTKNIQSIEPNLTQTGNIRVKVDRGFPPLQIDAFNSNKSLKQEEVLRNRLFMFYEVADINMIIPFKPMKDCLLENLLPPVPSDEEIVAIIEDVITGAKYNAVAGVLRGIRCRGYVDKQLLKFENKENQGVASIKVNIDKQSSMDTHSKVGKHEAVTIQAKVENQATVITQVETEKQAAMDSKAEASKHATMDTHARPERRDLVKNHTCTKTQTNSDELNKKERLQVFKNDCVAITTTVKLLIRKNPDLEARLVLSCKDILNELSLAFQRNMALS